MVPCGARNVTWGGQNIEKYSESCIEGAFGELKREASTYVIKKNTFAIAFIPDVDYFQNALAIQNKIILRIRTHPPIISNQ